MNRSPIAVVLAFAALCANGCGTIWNLSRGSDMQPYGGVRRWGSDHESKASTGDNHGFSPGPALSIALLGPMLVVMATEVCLTLVGDTLTLPLTCYVDAHRSRKATADHAGSDIVTPPTTADTSHE
jgi:hypothetical protein